MDAGRRAEASEGFPSVVTVVFCHTPGQVAAVLQLFAERFEMRITGQFIEFGGFAFIERAAEVFDEKFDPMLQ